MIQYELNCNFPNQHYIQFKAIFPVNESVTILKLSVWRPGRYELGNFAKNIRNFRVYSSQNKSIEFKKIDKSSWEIQSENESEIFIEYEYFASELNAGSSFLDETQLYVNPVNCIFYSDNSKDEEYCLKLNIPSNWEIATSLKIENSSLFATNYEELADSPFICSHYLAKETYEVEQIKFHIWFNKQKFIDWDRLKKDFVRFTQKQIQAFGHFPANEFHFLIHSLPYAAYHGVEHLKSTVITLGPSYDIFGSQYNELLGVSSHELYHVWNVKSIRPKEMYPYNFEKENYSSLGYVYEGVTTYMGDLYLLKSGVFNLSTYLNELNKQLQKHYDNPGRYNYSVAQSSLDTWLDGYVQGAPGRKVSIYTEGCLLAFVADIMIRKAAQNKYGIEEVMKRLYVDIAQQEKGYEQADYKLILEDVSGLSFDDYFENYINGTRPYDELVMNALNYLGLELVQKPSSLYSESKLGFKVLSKGKNFVVQAIHPQSPAALGGLSLGDEITAVNDIRLNGDLNQWLQYFDSEQKSLTISREGRMMNIQLTGSDNCYYFDYKILLSNLITGDQMNNLRSWGEEGIDF